MTNNQALIATRIREPIPLPEIPWLFRLGMIKPAGLL